MPSLHELPSRPDGGHGLHVVVESPRGSRVKITYDPDLGAFTLGRPLVLGVSYPYDWGFVPNTLAPDGDPLDAMVIADAATYPGVVIACRPFGVVRVSEKKEKGTGRQRNDRLIVTPLATRRGKNDDHPADLDRRGREELEQFFLTAVLLENKAVKLEGWGDAREAERLLRAAEKAKKKS